MQTKEQIYEDFQKLKSNKAKVKYLEGHRDAAKAHPGQYNHLRINWDHLITAWSSPNPRDYFYKKVFGRTFKEQMEYQERTAEKEEKDVGDRTKSVDKVLR